MSLERAFAATTLLSEALQREIERARGEREHFRSLDARQLFELAAARDAFNRRSEQLTRELASALGEAADELGIGTASLEAFARVDPARTHELAQGLACVRALSAALAELDALNRHLAERALACVRVYTKLVTPRPAAYGPRGAPPPSVGHALSQRA